MSIKLRKISETAYLEPTATGIRKPFNYRTAFIFFIIIAVAFLVVGLVFMSVLTGRVSTTEAWVEPTVELNINAKSDVRINELFVKYGDLVKKGASIFTTQPAEGSGAQGHIDIKKKDLEEAQQRFVLIESGADLGTLGVKLNDLQDRWNVKHDVMKRAEADRDKAKVEFDIANEKYEEAKIQYNEERIITKDRFDFACKQYKKTKIDYEAKENIYIEAKHTFDEIDAQKIKMKDSVLSAEESREKLIALQELKVEQAQSALDLEEEKYGVKTYKAEFDCRIGWIEINQGDRVSKGDRIMKVFKPATLEIIARFDGNVAKDIKEGQEVDIKVRTGSEPIKLHGTVSAIVNPFFKKSPRDRERLRTEIPFVDITKREVRISVTEDENFEKAKKLLNPGDPASVTIDTRD